MEIDRKKLSVKKLVLDDEFNYKERRHPNYRMYKKNTKQMKKIIKEKI